MAGLEGLVFGGLDLNDDVSYTIEELDLGNAAKRLEWATGADADGALLVRDPLSELRTITARIRVVPQATQTAALDKIAAVSKKLEEAEAQGDGLDLLWTPATTTTKALTFYVLTGEIAPLPIAPTGSDAGYFVRAPVFTVKLTCKPFGYEPEVLYATSTTSSDILPTLVVSGVPGDVPAEGRLVVTDLASKDRAHVEWGLEWRALAALQTNLVTNPSVEIDTSGYTAFGGTPVARSTAQAYVGFASLLATYNGDLRLTSVPVGAASAGPLDYVTMSAYVWIPSAWDGGQLVMAHDGTISGATFVSDVNANMALLNQWQQISLVMRNDATSDTFGVYLRAASAATVGRSIYVDATQVTVSSSPGLSAYFGGDTPGYSWTGAPHASTSTTSYSLNTSLVVDSDSMVVTGFNGTQTTQGGAYDPNATGSNVVRGTLGAVPSALCSTGNLSHVGTFRVKLRCFPSSTSVRVRLTWREGDGTYSRNAYAVPVVANNWNDLDLGIISIPAKQLGTQRWTGVVEAYSSTADTLDVDALLLIPAGEGYGKGRAKIDVSAPVGYSAQDAFDQTAGALTGKTLPVGGTWVGAGATTDFSVNSTTHKAERTTSTGDVGASVLVAGRVLTASTPTALTNTYVSADLTQTTPYGAGGTGAYLGVVARYTNINNYLVAYLQPGFAAGQVSLWKRAASVETFLAAVPYGSPGPTFLNGVNTLSLAVTSGGAVVVAINGTTVLALSDTSLVSGGALASGSVGLFDFSGTSQTTTRTFDNFSAYAPAYDAVVFSGRAAEFRFDGATRKDPTGTYYGRVQTYRGARFMIPAAGDQNRSSRIAVKARRNDVDLAADDQITDSTKIEVYYRARHAIVRTT